MAGFLIEEYNGKDYVLSGLSETHVRLNPKLNGSSYLAWVMSSVEQVEAGIITLLPHQSKGVLSLRHVAVLAPHTLPGVWPLHPFQLRAFHPDAVRIFLIVTVAAEFRGPEEIILNDLVCRRLYFRLPTAVFYPPGFDVVAEIERRINLCPPGKMADLARD